MELTLTESGIIHLSAGFDGPYILQAFGVKKQPTNPHIYNMCLTDGQVYIGAIYSAPKFFDLQNYNVVKVFAQFCDRMKPVNIKNLQIISKIHRKLIGKPPLTLIDHFNQSIQEPQSEPKKKIKRDTDDFHPVLFANNHTKIVQQQKVIPVKDQITNQKQSYKSNQKKNGSPHDLKMQKKLKIASQSDSDQDNIKSQSPDNIKAAFIKQPAHTNTTNVSPIVNLEGQVENSYIHDLFQRHVGWVILCRVNYKSLAKCQNGLNAVNFVLSDQYNDEIKCVYFQASSQKAKQMFKVGKFYLFAGGQIKLTKDGENQIIFDRNSQFLQKQNVTFQINTKKVTRIDRINQQQPDSQINTIGVIRKLKNIKGQNVKSKTKYSASLCDPLTKCEVEFVVFLNQDEKSIQPGMIVTLHNYKVQQAGVTFKLNSSFKSYYFHEKPSSSQKHALDLVNQFFKFTQNNNDWELQKYKNISSFPFTPRNIYDLKNIYKHTQDEKMYSLVDCWVMQISKKKFYYACKTCKKPTQRRSSILYFCPNCKKMVDTNLTYTMSATFCDYTSSLMIDVIGQHAQHLIQKTAIAFYSLEQVDQPIYLESLRYKNIQIRLKTQKKPDNKLTHSVWGVESSTPQFSLAQIKKLVYQDNVKFDQSF